MRKGRKVMVRKRMEMKMRLRQLGTNELLQIMRMTRQPKRKVNFFWNGPPWPSHLPPPSSESEFSHLPDGSPAHAEGSSPPLNRHCECATREEKLPKLPRLCFFFLKSTLKRKICLHLLLTSYIFVHIVRGQLFLVMWDDQAALWRVPCLLPPRGVTELVAIRKEKRSLVKKKQNQQQNNLTPVTICVCVFRCIIVSWFVRG